MGGEERKMGSELAALAAGFRLPAAAACLTKSMGQRTSLIVLGEGSIAEYPDWMWHLATWRDLRSQRPVHPTRR